MSQGGKHHESSVGGLVLTLALASIVCAPVSGQSESVGLRQTTASFHNIAGEILCPTAKIRETLSDLMRELAGIDMDFEVAGRA